MPPATATPEAETTAKPKTLAMFDDSKRPVRTRPDTITVVESVYFVSETHRQFPLDTRFQTPLATRQQPYVRRSTVPGHWTPLDLGWIAGQVGMVVVKNLSPVGRGSLVVGLSSGKPGGDGDMWDSPDPSVVEMATIPPGESLRFRPADRTGACLVIRSVGEGDFPASSEVVAFGE